MILPAYNYRRIGKKIVRAFGKDEFEVPPQSDVCSIYDWLPDVTTSPTGTSNVLAMNPKTLNTTNPAKKLVPQFITLTMIASLWITKEYIRSL